MYICYNTLPDVRESGFQNPENFYLYVESELIPKNFACRIRNVRRGVQNPRLLDSLTWGETPAYPGFRKLDLPILIHHFIFIVPGYITNQSNDQLPVGLLAQLYRVLALLQYRTGRGSSPVKAQFFQAFFSQLHKKRYRFILHSAVPIYEIHTYIISMQIW